MTFHIASEIGEVLQVALSLGEAAEAAEAA
jgi:hypothetical protein